MARVVFVSSMPGMNRPADPLTTFLTRLAYLLAIFGAISTGWTRGGFLWALLYGCGMLVAFPFLLMIGTFALALLFPILALPGSFIATKLGWARFGPYAARRLVVERISAVMLLIPLVVFAQRNAWSLLGLFASMLMIGLTLILLAVLVVTLLLVRRFSSVGPQYESPIDPESTFRWIKPEPPRLPPPSED